MVGPFSAVGAGARIQVGKGRRGRMRRRGGRIPCGARTPRRTGLLTRGPTARGESQGKGERFCFLVTFIWALGDVGVRTLHKSGMAVCWCRHRDINPGARRLPSGYLFLLPLRRLFFVSPVYISNLLLSFSRIFLAHSFLSLFLYAFFISFCSVSSRLVSLLRDSRVQYGAPCSAYNVPNHYFSPVAPFALVPSLDWTCSTPLAHARPAVGAMLMIHERIITTPTSIEVCLPDFRRSTIVFRSNRA